MMDLFGILVQMNVNVINDVMLENLQIKLGKECREDINGNENIYNVTLNDHKKVSRTKFPIKFIIQYTQYY